MVLGSISTFPDVNSSSFEIHIMSILDQTLLIKYIGEDQAGFLLGRYICDNLRFVLDVTPTVKLGLFFLHAEKAFDNMNWQFMKRIFEEMLFGHKFLNAMGKIYATQNATIKINNELMETFPVHNIKNL